MTIRDRGKPAPMFQDINLNPSPTRLGVYRIDSYILPVDELVFMYGEMTRFGLGTAHVASSRRTVDDCYKFKCEVMGTSKDGVVDAVGGSRDMEINAQILASSIGLYCGAFLMVGAVLKK